MDFNFSDEQRQLRDAVQRYLGEQYPFARHRAIKASKSGWDRENWQGLAQLGVLALNVPEAQGGLGYGPLETLAVMDACGRSLVLEPVLSSAVIATRLLARHAAQSRVGALLRAMGAGAIIAVLAHFEPESGYDHQWVGTRARTLEDAYVLDGHKAVVMHAPCADVLLVSARTAGTGADWGGISLFRVPRDAPGMTLRPYRTLDAQAAAEIHLTDVRVDAADRIDLEGDALDGIAAALDAGLAALCAEAVGVMQALVEHTVQYLQTRQQFGQPLGKFQALQHRTAEMLIHLEQARSMSYLAALRCTEENLPERRRALSAAKAIIGQAARFIGQQAVQLHGGMGMTEEYIVSHFFRRLTAFDVQFGDSDAHVERYAALLAVA